MSFRFTGVFSSFVLKSFQNVLGLLHTRLLTMNDDSFLCTSRIRVFSKILKNLLSFVVCSWLLYLLIVSCQLSKVLQLCILPSRTKLCEYNTRSGSEFHLFWHLLRNVNVKMSVPRPPSSCLMKLRVTFAIIGALVGLSVLIVFGVQYHNWNVALWGLLSGINLKVAGVP